MRLEGDEYYGVIDEFCKAVKDAWPNCLLQVGGRAGGRAGAGFGRGSSGAGGQRSRSGCEGDQVPDRGAYSRHQRGPQLARLPACPPAPFPNTLPPPRQFEDFQTEKAFEILHRQRNKQLCFNDDIQARLVCVCL